MAQFNWKIKRGGKADKRHHYRWHILKALGGGVWLLYEADSNLLRGFWRIFKHYWDDIHCPPSAS